MEKDNFNEHTRYTISLADENDKLRPANIYVFRLYDQSMIVRDTDKSGLLRQIEYEKIKKIVKTRVIEVQNQFHIPDAILDEKNWDSRSEMFHYVSSTHAGK